ncbi:restriction endonuclease subunit S [Citricoccus muralis]|uniref:Restriction endonuclease subunit S n=1 Tax=Citricoccus muralis TaxID=169134 RepID=A0ABY8H667_9MICC|nr:restriction endonuclease subunit S [Citricoccus muralis]WFP16173.1 restriction endonuclease subunit S [Citricoccus muralis]
MNKLPFWLGEIPARWSLVKAKRVMSVVKEIPGAGLAADYDRLSLTMSGVLPRAKDDRDGLQPADFNSYQLLRPGQLVFKLIDLMNVATSRVGLSDDTGLVSPAYIVTSLGPGVDARFMHYYFHDLYSRRIFNFLGSAGVRSSLGPKDLMALPILLPPLDEQRAIADYLDQETAQIDALVAKQEEFIGLLRERRSAVRDSALTGGLNGIGVSKRTGNVWLPILPSGWRAVPTRRLLSFGPSNGVSPEAGRVGDMRSLSIGAVRDGRVKASEEVTKYVDRDSLRDVSQFLLHYGDVLIVRGNGNISMVGRAGMVGNEFTQEEYIYPDLLIRIRTTADMRPDFFVAALDTPTSRAQIELLARTTVGTFKISAADVRSIVLPCPPIDEQHAIIEHISQQTSRIDALITKAEEHIALAKERRAALITAAVTGQFDVRTARKAG